MTSPLRTYHHGDLRQALLDEGLARARSGGPAAVSLREITRAVGVSPNAAYRHFEGRDGLVHAVAGQAQLALATAIAERVAATAPELDPAAASIEKLRRVGLAYIAFARAEPGWFATAFFTQDTQATDGVVTLDGDIVPPFELLMKVLDEMVATGALAPARRPLAEFACWSTVHGFADIAVNGPVRWQPEPVIDALAASVVESIIAGVRGTADVPGPAPAPRVVSPA